MIDQAEAERRARALVIQFISGAGPDRIDDYAQLLTDLMRVTVFTLMNYLGADEAMKHVQGTIGDIADMLEQGPPPARPPALMH